MREYDIESRNTYNLDEKGFFVGITTRSKRVFTKAIWASKEPTAAIQDGNKEWITLLICVCASGEALPPALIYEGKSGLQSGWIDIVEAGKHEVFFIDENTSMMSRRNLLAPMPPGSQLTDRVIPKAKEISKTVKEVSLLE
jgi:hypothetical protein